MRAFAEVMKNMARMKACVRPAMCKPYGKQSEALQKSNKYFRIIYNDSFFVKVIGKDSHVRYQLQHWLTRYSLYNR